VDNWIMPTEQELFDNAALGIRWQRFERAIQAGRCVSQTLDGRRCALGHSITDAKPGALETRQWAQIYSTLLGCALVSAHDSSLMLGTKCWFDRMAEIALHFGLDDSALYFTEKV
jgi:hypothetical protein